MVTKAAANKAQSGDLAVVPTTPPPDPEPAPREFRINRRGKKRLPIPFTLVIETTNESGEPEEIVEQFHARPYVPGAVILDVAASFTRDGSWQAAAIQRLLDVALPDDEKERWAKTLAHPDAPDLPELGDIADYLCEQYGERPTQSA